MPPVLDDNLLKGYLLGELSDAELARVEQLVFSDTDLYDRLQALKAEITDQYVRETLDPKRREVFARRFLATEAGREDALFARALDGVLRAEHTERELAVRDPAPVSWRQSVREFFSFSSAWKPAMAGAMALLLIGCGWLFVERQRLIERMETASRERDSAQSEARKNALLEAEMNRLSARNRELDETLRQTREDLNAVRQNLDQMVRQSKAASALGAILFLVLAPGARRGNERVEELIVDSRARTVHLQLLLEPGESGASFRAEVRRKDGPLIYRQDRLRVRRTAKGNALLVNLPANRLKDGRHEVSLYDSKAVGKQEILKDYEFSVTRRF
jgi:anti-sigma factor RsiW